ncbi:hypothetical protein BFL35_07340 [Clavibacter michiganensis]|nr:hypothetical protein BFL35_07340 [Clavibacter michiganensis]
MAQQRRLPGAGEAQQHHDLAAGDLERDVVERGRRAEPLGEPGDLDDLASGGDRPRGSAYFFWHWADFVVSHVWRTWS